jgi:putative tricarboxylic transport membrane protein
VNDNRETEGGRGRLRHWAEIAFAVALPVFSLLFIWQASLVRDPPRNVVVGPRTFPYIVGAAMFVVSSILLWKLLRGGPQEPNLLPEVDEEGEPLNEEDVTISDWPAVGVVLGSLLAMFFLFERLGFVVSIGLFLFGVSTFFSPSHWLRNLITGVVFGTFFYFLFSRVLGITLPVGTLWAPLLGS